jgi:hypothetical protein
VDFQLLLIKLQTCGEKESDVILGEKETDVILGEKETDSIIGE